jgi:uncharacterized OB-fold protein
MNAATRPRPNLEGPDRPYWEGLRRGEVWVQRCGACGTHRFPSARFCAKCLSEDTEWVRVEPAGTLESWCVFHQSYFPGLPTPYTVVQVRLDCGVRLFSNPARGGSENLRIGARVNGVFDDVGGGVTLLMFEIVGASVS